MEETPSALERILDAAAEEFGRMGFSGAKVEAIARRAGVNKSGLYYHVGNKEKLYEAVLLRLFGQAAQALEQAVAAEPDPARGIWALVGAVAGMFERVSALPRIMALEMASGGGTLPESVILELRRVLGVTQGVIARGAAAGAMQPAQPILVHLALVGPLIVFALSEPLRRRFAPMARDMGLRLDVPLAEAAAFVADVMGRGLSTACADALNNREQPHEKA